MIRIWSLVCLWNLLREPALKLTMPRLRFVPSFGWNTFCRVTGFPVNSALAAGSWATSLGLTTFTAFLPGLQAAGFAHQLSIPAPPDRVLGSDGRTGGRPDA